MIRSLILIAKLLTVSSLSFYSPVKEMQQDALPDLSITNQLNQTIGLSTVPVKLASSSTLGEDTTITEPAGYSGLNTCCSNPMFSDLISQNQLFLAQINSKLSQFDATKPKEIGFITKTSSHSAVVSVHVAKVRFSDKQQYAFNFDGSELVYFDLSKPIELPNEEPKSAQSIFSHKKNLFSNVGKMVVSKSIQGLIMDRVINKNNILEANHISVDQDRIFLDTKEIKIDNQPEMERSINQTVDALNRGSYQKSEQGLRIVWKARHRH